MQISADAYEHGMDECLSHLWDSAGLSGCYDDEGSDHESGAQSEGGDGSLASIESGDSESSLRSVASRASSSQFSTDLLAGDERGGADGEASDVGGSEAGVPLFKCLLGSIDLSKIGDSENRLVASHKFSQRTCNSFLPRSDTHRCNLKIYRCSNLIWNI